MNWNDERNATAQSLNFKTLLVANSAFGVALAISIDAGSKIAIAVFAFILMLSIPLSIYWWLENNE